MDQQFSKNDCHNWMLEHVLVHLWAAFINNGGASNQSQIDYITRITREEVEAARDRVDDPVTQEFANQVIELQKEFWGRVRRAAGD